jgi:hypothetical protein
LKVIDEELQVTGVDMSPRGVLVETCCR